MSYASIRFAIVRCFDACRRAQGFRSLTLATSLRARNDFLTSLERSKRAKESESDGEKNRFFFSIRCASSSKDEADKVTLTLAFLHSLPFFPSTSKDLRNEKFLKATLAY